MNTVEHPIDAAIGLLTCPVCGGLLARRDAVLRCPAAHSFDLARQGHVNLLGHGAPANADTAQMVAARERFLVSGLYSPIRDAAAAACVGAETVLEAGAGTGYYLAGVLAAEPRHRHLALDVSVAAVRRAARAGLAAAVADTWAGLPVADSCVDALLCVFAPRNADEFVRVLRPAGQVVVVTPTPNHLAVLRERHALLTVPDDKLDRLDAGFAAAGLRLAGREEVGFALHLDAAQVADLIGMGPNAFHRSGQPAAAGLDDLAEVSVSRYVRA